VQVTAAETGRVDCCAQSSVRAELVETEAHSQPFGLSLSKPGLAMATSCLCWGRRPGVARRAS